MLKFINEELFSFKPIEVKDEKSDKSYTKLQVVNTNKLQQVTQDAPYGRNRNYGYGSNQNSQGNRNSKVTNDEGVLRPVVREILRISAPLKPFDIDFDTVDVKTVGLDNPMSLNVKSNGRNGQHVEIRCHEQGDDRVNMFVIAFPFNGMIKPIPANEQYRIYKGVIATSAKPIFFNGRRYKKVLYLVIEINKNLFNPDHKYHTDSIDIELESYAIFDNRDTGEKNTNYERFNLSITSKDADYTTAWYAETLDEPVYIKVEDGSLLWNVFKFDNKQHSSQSTYSRPAPQRKQYFNGNGGAGSTQYTKPSGGSGYSPNNSNENRNNQSDVKVSVNKHGIRKETTPSYGKHAKNMFFDEGYDDGDFGNRGTRGSRQKTSNKKRKKNSGHGDYY